MSQLRQSVVKLLVQHCGNNGVLDEIGARSGCHRLPERSFFYQGHQFPICARCTGVCIGELSALLIHLFCQIPWTISVFFLSVMGFDWGIQELGIKTSTNRRRFITGILGGLGLFSIYIAVFKHIFQKIHRHLSL